MPLLSPLLLEKLARLRLTVNRVAEGSSGGARPAKHLEASQEFHQHRFFARGDDPRQIDWRIFARTGRLNVREYRDETNLRAVLMLDASGSMEYGRLFGTKFNYAQRLTAALAFLLLTHRDSVGLGLFTEKLDEWLQPASAGVQLSALLTMVSHRRPHGISHLGRSIQSVADRLTRRSVVIIISDLLMPIDQFSIAMALLRDRRHEPVVIRVLDADETSFPFTHPTQFCGLEQEHSIARDPSLLRDRYNQRFNLHRKALLRICAREKVSFWDFSTEQPLEEALPRYLELTDIR